MLRHLRCIAPFPLWRYCQYFTIRSPVTLHSIHYPAHLLFLGSFLCACSNYWASCTRMLCIHMTWKTCEVLCDHSQCKARHNRWQCISLRIHSQTVLLPLPSLCIHSQAVLLPLSSLFIHSHTVFFTSVSLYKQAQTALLPFYHCTYIHIWQH